MKRWVVILVFASALAAAFTTDARAAEDAPAASPSPAHATVETGRARQDLEQILEGPQYQRWKLRSGRPTGDGENQTIKAFRQWMSDHWDDFWKWVGKFFRSNRRRAAVTPGSTGGFALGGLMNVIVAIGWVLLFAVIAFVVFVVVRSLRGFKLPKRKARVLSREQVRKALEDGAALALESPQWMAEADRLTSQRDARAVYRALYLALLSGLHTAGKIDFRRTRTNWVYVGQYRGQDVERQTFTSLTGLFDDVWYGQQPALATNIAPLRQQVSSLIGEYAATPAALAGGAGNEGRR